ncbi:MAG: Rnase Y domain-containing protein, partial [Patescibacteria group bacterium]
MDYNLILGGGFLLIGLLIGYLVRQQIALRNVNSIEQQVKVKLEKAEDEAREILLDAKSKVAGLFEEVKKEEKERKIQLDRMEERLIKKEEVLEKQISNIHNKESQLIKEGEKLAALQTELNQAEARMLKELEKVAGLSQEDAKLKLIEQIKHEYNNDLALIVQKLEQHRRDEIEKKSVEIIT